MRNRASEESYAVWENNECRSYAGYPAVSYLLKGASSDPESWTQPQSLELDSAPATMLPTTDEGRAVRESVVDASIDSPEVADLAQRLEDLDDKRRARLMGILFPSPGPLSPDRE
jgi:hypothetical protein